MVADPDPDRRQEVHAGQQAQLRATHAMAPDQGDRREQAQDREDHDEQGNPPLERPARRLAAYTP